MFVREGAIEYDNSTDVELSTSGGNQSFAQYVCVVLNSVFIEDVFSDDGPRTPSVTQALFAEGNPAGVWD